VGDDIVMAEGKMAFEREIKESEHNQSDGLKLLTRL
jgi:hypothetical protein